MSCAWANSSELYKKYHDLEWGVPIHDDTKLFEYLILEGAQAGLNWRLILERRKHYRQAFDFFDVAKIACYDEGKFLELLANAGIIRNKLKIAAAINNAKKFLDVQENYGSFDAYIWQFVGGNPIQNAWRNVNLIPASTIESDAMSKSLKKLGFKYVGTTICYAFMQAVGMVNDHTTDCPRWAQIAESKASKRK